MLAFQPERVRPITCPAFRAGLFESPLEPRPVGPGRSLARSSSLDRSR